MIPTLSFSCMKGELFITVIQFHSIIISSHFPLPGGGASYSSQRQYIYRLHKALGDYEQAAVTALILAKQEQHSGNYKVAHYLLFTTFQVRRQRLWN
jgi:hypothetical protein